MTFEADLPEDLDQAAVVLASSAWKSYFSAIPERSLGDEGPYEHAIVSTLRDIGFTAVQAEEISMFTRLSAQLELMPSELD